jgi:hypothetical protein
MISEDDVTDFDFRVCWLIYQVVAGTAMAVIAYRVWKFCNNIELFMERKTKGKK